MITHFTSFPSRTARRLLHLSTAQRGAASALQHQHFSLLNDSHGSQLAALYLSANSATVEAEWSHQLTFTSPDLDFVAASPVERANSPQLRVSADSATVESEWAQQIQIANARHDVWQLQAAPKQREMPRVTSLSPNLKVSADSATVESEWAQQVLMADDRRDAEQLRTALKRGETNRVSIPKPIPQLQVSADSATVESEWAQQILMADAKRDVEHLQTALEYQPQLDGPALDRMLQQLQMSSPESAIGYTHVAETMSDSVKADFQAALQEKGLPCTLEEEPVGLNQADVARMMQFLHLSSPESAIGFTHVAEVLGNSQKEQLASYYEMHGQEVPSALPEETNTSTAVDDLLLQQMLMASPESATGYVHAAETLTSPLKAELGTLATPLPASLEEVAHDRRAIVVTTATPPFRVVHVNAAWEGLCGYTQEEAHHQPIGVLLKGPETDVARKMIHEIQAHPETAQAAVIVNYTKTGRKFRNRLQVGPMYANGNVEYLVGVLREVEEEVDGIRMAA